MKKKESFLKYFLISIILVYSFLSTGIAQEIPQGQDTISLEKGSGDSGEFDEEIYIENLPEAVRVSIDEGYHGYEVMRAYRNNEGNFRIEVENGSDKAVVYYDMNGKFLKAEEFNNASSMQDM